MIRRTLVLSLMVTGLLAAPRVDLAQDRWQTQLAATSTIRYVATDGADSGGCDSVAGRCRTIQYAVDASDPGDEIHVAGGLYAPGGTVATITQAVRIIGSYDLAFAGPDPDLSETVLDAGWNGSVVHIDSAHSVTLEHLTLTHGDGSGICPSDVGCGGGVYARYTELLIRHCRIIHNVANSTGSEEGRGGGVYVYSSDHKVQIRSSEIVSNTANTSTSAQHYSRGGGLFLRNGTAVLAENRILDNVGSSAGAGEQGGGVYLYSVEHAQILQNRLENNRGTRSVATNSDGGGLVLFASTADVIGNWIEGNWTNPNHAGSGGGAYIVQSSVHLDRNTIVGNVTRPPGTGWGTLGGGVYIACSQPVTLSNNLVAFNQAYSGGGVYLNGDSTFPTAAIMVNNTVADNDSGIDVEEHTTLTLTNNVVAGHSVGVTNHYSATSAVAADTSLFWNASDPIVGSNAILADPLLTPGYRLSPGSPAVDVGLTISWMTVDIAGIPRPQGAGYDLGAFELVYRSYLPLVVRNHSGL